MPTSPVLGDLRPVHSHRENSGARCTLAGHPQLQRGCHSGKVTCGTRDGCRWSTVWNDIWHLQLSTLMCLMYFGLQLPTIFETAVDKSSHSACGRCPINTRDRTLDRWLSWSETLTSEKHAGKWILLALIRKTLLTAKPNWLQRESCSALSLAAAGHCKRRLHTAWTVHSALTNRRTDRRTFSPCLLHKKSQQSLSTGTPRNPS